MLLIHPQDLLCLLMKQIQGQDDDGDDDEEDDHEKEQAE